MYISVGEGRAALGLDIGDGVVRRFDEAANDVVGLTGVGVRERLLATLGDKKW